jgi:hypothetical protein
MIASEVARYLNRSPLEMEMLLASSKQGLAATVDAVNTYNELLYDLIIPELFGHLYSLNPTEEAEEHEVELVKVPPEGFYRVTAAKDKIVRQTDAAAKQVAHKSFHLDTYCFDSKPEQTLFWDLIREGKVRKLYFTGMLTHGQSDFFIQYIDPDSKTVRTYYPDFLFEREDGKMVIVEVKADYQMDTPVVQAKREFAEQMAVASGMAYELIKSTDAEAHSYGFVSWRSALSILLISGFAHQGSRATSAASNTSNSSSTRRAMAALLAAAAVASAFAFSIASASSLARNAVTYSATRLPLRQPRRWNSLVTVAGETPSSRAI